MRYHKMHRHWEKFGPPVYISVAGYLGLIQEDTTDSKSPLTTKPEEVKTKGTMAELAAMFKGGVIR